jgi:RNA polymerase-interacting CarD/CdnL/TRCF family regulator
MGYIIGDRVFHWTHGLGTVIAIEEKLLSGVVHEYYVVEVGILKLWVPTDEANEGSLRPPSEEEDFKRTLHSLQTPGENLSDNYTKRKFQLRDRIQRRTLESLCFLIRDLTQRSHDHVLNPNDNAVLFRAQEHLLDEWVLSLGVERESAQSELDALLQAEGVQTNINI